LELQERGRDRSVGAGGRPLRPGAHRGLLGAAASARACREGTLGVAAARLQGDGEVQGHRLHHPRGLRHPRPRRLRHQGLLRRGPGGELPGRGPGRGRRGGHVQLPLGPRRRQGRLLHPAGPRVALQPLRAAERAGPPGRGALRPRVLRHRRHAQGLGGLRQLRRHVFRRGLRRPPTLGAPPHRGAAGLRQRRGAAARGAAAGP